MALLYTNNNTVKYVIIKGEKIDFISMKRIEKSLCFFSFLDY